VSRPPRDRQAERDAIHAAAARLLAGTPPRSATGGLSATELATESGLPRWKLYEHRDLVEDFQARVHAQDAVPDAQLQLKADNERLAANLADTSAAPHRRTGPRRLAAARARRGVNRAGTRTARCDEPHGPGHHNTHARAATRLNRTPPFDPILDATLVTVECYARYMSGGGGVSERFLLISVSTVGGPPSLRVQVWRKLRSLGALYLQQSVCLLPARDRPSREVSRLLARVNARGGTGRVITIEVPDDGEHAALMAEFNAARDAEYGEVLERTPAMLAEIATETARRRATYAEVEESEADLNRFRGWLAKIVARDYFDAPTRSAADAAVAECAQALAAFEAAALSAEAGTDPEQTAVSPAVPRVNLTLVEGS
jgi:hypothetical protein